MTNLKSEKCASVKEYVIEIIEDREQSILYYNRLIRDIIKGCEITKRIAMELEKLFGIKYKIFLYIDSMYKLEQRHLKRKCMQKIKGVAKMKKACPSCKDTMIEKESPATDCNILHCGNCGVDYIYNQKTLELIKLEHRIKA